MKKLLTLALLLPLVAFARFGPDGIVLDGGEIITDATLTGDSHELVTSTGSRTAGNCAEWDAAGNLIDAGAACGTGGGSGTPAGSNGDIQINSSGSFGAITPGSNCSTFIVTPSSANLRACLTDEVGTGAFYTVGGALGTPASGVATNLTGTASGLTAGAASALAANPTNCSAGSYPLGIDASGNVESCTAAAGGLASTDLDTSAELRALVTDEVGTGALYFVGGALGTPASGVATNLTGTASGLTAGAATALAANPTNCSAGSYPLGIDASGNVESCTAASGGLASTDLDTSAELRTLVTDESGTGALIFAGGAIAAATATTASADDNDTSVATTAFVQGELTAYASDTVTFTNKTLTTPTITLKQSTSPTPTAEGAIEWDTDDNALAIGDGAATKILPTVGGTPAAGTLAYFTSATAMTSLGIGTNGQCLKTNAGATAPEWGSCAGGSLASTDIDTSAELRTLVTDESGTGALIFADGAIGAATATTASANDNDTSVATTAYVQTELTAYASDTVTFTTKTYDVEASGNVFTSVSKVWLPAAGCNNATASSFWDLPTSNAGAPGCVTGTNTQKGVLDFDAATSESAQTTLALPADFTGTVDARIKWFAAATSGNVIWNVATICVADAETDDPAFNTASAVTDTTKGTTNQTNDASITGVTITGCAAGELMHVKISRDAAAGGDTMTGDARLIGLELSIRRAQ